MRKELIDKLLKPVEVYLTEFCKVYGIQESELKNVVIVKTHSQMGSVVVVNVDDERDVLFGVRVSSANAVEVFNFEDEEKFPETSKMVKGLQTAE